jgi:hypothetical protein
VITGLPLQRDAGGIADLDPDAARRRSKQLPTPKAQAFLLTPQKNGSSPCGTPMMFLYQV